MVVVAPFLHLGFVHAVSAAVGRRSIDRLGTRAENYDRIQFSISAESGSTNELAY